MNDKDVYATIGYDAAVLRKEYKIICEDNFCAAFLLDKFYASTETAAEFLRFTSEDASLYVYMSINEIAASLLDLYDTKTITDACIFLLKKGYIEAEGDIEESAEAHKGNMSFDDIIYEITCNRETVQRDIQAYYTAFDKEINEHIAAKINELTIEEEQAKRIAGEIQKVKSHNRRAAKVNLPATLTLDQWIATLDYFEWKCAYCKGKYTLLEHFIPLNHGVGTTATNCVPACGSCNIIKQAWNPLASWGPDMAKIKDGIKRVQQYFETLIAQEKQDEAG